MGQAHVRSRDGGPVAHVADELDGLVAKGPGRPHQTGEGQEREREPITPYGGGRPRLTAMGPAHEVPPSAFSCASRRRLVCAYSLSSSTEVRTRAASQVEPSSKWNSTGTEPWRARGS